MEVEIRNKVLSLLDQHQIMTIAGDPGTYVPVEEPSTASDSDTAFLLGWQPELLPRPRIKPPANITPHLALLVARGTCARLARVVSRFKPQGKCRSPAE